MSATPVGQRAALHAQRITFFFASGQSRMRPTLPSGSANLRIIFLVAQGVSVTGFPAGPIENARRWDENCLYVRRVQD